MFDSFGPLQYKNMIKRVCKYCKEELEFEKAQQFGAHVRNCSCNPNREEYNKRAALSIKKHFDSKKKKYIFKCKGYNCNNEIKLFLTENQYKRGRYKKYCSSFCAHNRGREKKECIICGKIIRRNSNKFCSHKCQNIYNYKQYIEKWKEGKVSGNKGNKGDNISGHVRKYIFEKYNNKCVKCGWGELNKHTNKIPLHVHHIDGNYKNTVEKNLTLLCPNCHSLTKNYGGSNKGCGRERRQEWRKRRRSV